VSRLVIENENAARHDLGQARRQPAWLAGRPALPFHELSGDEFEVFCYLLLLREKPDQRVVYYGKTGDAGRDIVRWTSSDTVELIQCKRYKTNVGAANVKKEITKLCANVFRNTIATPPDRVVFYAVPGLTPSAIDLLDNRDKWLAVCEKALQEHLGEKPHADLVEYARTWWPEFDHEDEHKLTHRATAHRDLIEEFFQVRYVVTGSLAEIEPRLAGVEQSVEAMRTQVGEVVGGVVAANQTAAGKDGAETHITEGIPDYLAALRGGLDRWCGLGLGRNISVTDVYVQQILATPSREERPPMLEAAGLRSTESNPESQLRERLCGKDVDGQYVLIEGPPGSGKTTLLRKWTLELSGENVTTGERALIPIIYQLGLAGQLCERDAALDVPLPRLVSDELPNLSHGSADAIAGVLAELIQSGSAIILLDAADEVPKESTHKIRRWFDRLRERANDCPIVVTTRPNSWISSALPFLRDHETHELSPFTCDQRKTMIRHWFNAGKLPGAAEEMIAELNNTRRLFEMASNPLFLTMMCVEYEILGRMYDKAGPMFEEFVRLLLETWDRERGVRRKLTSQRVYPVELKLQILGTIAAHFLEIDKRIFHESHVLRVVEDELHDRRTDSDANALIDEIERTSGLVFRDRFGRYRFCHPLFQEFFAARDLFRRDRDDESRDDWIGTRFWDDRYKNVTAFYGELVEHDES
jgi:hypothetical protein